MYVVDGGAQKESRTKRKDKVIEICKSDIHKIMSDKDSKYNQVELTVFLEEA